MIHVISTSANIQDSYDLRKQQYLAGLQSVITHYKKNPYIVECANKTDYLSEHYSGYNTSDNKGVSEIENMKAFFSETNFQDTDYIIKHTLRYEISSSFLLDEVCKAEFEVYGKDSSDIYGGGKFEGVHTFLFAMTVKCWKEFFQIYDRNVNKDYPMERQYINFIKTKDTKFLDKLGIRANPWSHKRIYEV
jgi:hypothetical protein